MRDKVRILEFARPFSGIYKRVKYASDLPLPKQFPNHTSFRKFFESISQEINPRVTTGAFRVWGKVGVDKPPYLVLPLTVEPSKPRLCIDGRFLNLWMRDMPFSLEKLVDVPRYINRGSFMTKCEDKSGYDRVLLSEDSDFGFRFRGLWFVCITLPFEWKISHYIIILLAWLLRVS